MTNVPAPIVTAILNIRKAVKSLKKDTLNPHGGYKYVPIDSYYERVVPLANEVGLVWHCHETGSELIQNQGRDKSHTWVKATFAYDVMVGEATCHNYMVISVVQPVTGPQTTGQLYSYADKVFMRVAFAVPTGEADGDEVEQTPMVATAVAHSPNEKRDNVIPFSAGDVPVGHDPITGEILEPTPAKAATVLSSSGEDGEPILDPQMIDSEKACDLVIAIFREFMPTVKSARKLLDWHTENLAALEKVDRVSPSRRETIRGMFNERNMQLGAKV